MGIKSLHTIVKIAGFRDVRNETRINRVGSFFALMGYIATNKVRVKNKLIPFGRGDKKELAVTWLQKCDF